MKKILIFMMLTMVLCMTACGDAKEDAKLEEETIKIQAYNENKELIDVEVPYDPQRIAILDMPALDIVDALGVGDRVVGSAKVTIEYLTDYNDSVMNLGTVKTADLEKVAACEPDIIFIGGSNYVVGELLSSNLSPE